MWKYNLLLLYGISLIFTCAAGKSCVNKSVNASDRKPKNYTIFPRIINGNKTALGQSPQQVSLRRRYSQAHFCGGSVLTPYWVLTAAHCMIAYDKYIAAHTILVIAGEVELKTKDRARQWSYVSKRIIHSEFDSDTLNNDIALLRMKVPFKFDPYVHHIPLMRAKVTPNTVCQVFGWGLTKFHGNVSYDLQHVDIPIIAVELCRSLLQSYCSVPPGMICAGYREGGRDACQGDSGGGLLCRGYLTGLVSAGIGCAEPNLPGLYTDVAHFLSWIKRFVDLDKNYPIRSTPFNGTPFSSKTASVFITIVCVLGVLFMYL